MAASTNHGEIARWAEDVVALADLARSLGRSSPRVARRAVCQVARRIAGAPVAILAEEVADGAALSVVEAAGADLRGLELPLTGDGSGPARAIAERRPAIRTVPSTLGPERELLARAGARSVAWFPVGGRGRGRRAVLAVAWPKRAMAVPPRVASLLDLLAAEADLALGQAEEIDRLHRMVRTDEVTGLPNRRALEEQLPRELARARREGASVAVAMLDLDHFKAFNDEHGHIAGDRLLERAAAVWRQALRPYDVLARFGGEEFTVILPGCDLDAAAGIVERLRSVTPSGTSCSAGVVVWAPPEHPETLIARADGAMYEAKRAGRARTVAAAAA